MFVIIDRFEGNYAVVELEGRFMVYMPIDLLPEGAKEGDVIRIEIDIEKTNGRKSVVDKLTDGLWQ